MAGIADVFRELLAGSPETGRALLGPSNVLDVLKAPLALGIAPGTRTQGSSPVGENLAITSEILSRFLSQPGIAPGTRIGDATSVPQTIAPQTAAPQATPQVSTAPQIPQGLLPPTTSLAGGAVTGTAQGKTPKALPAEKEKGSPFLTLENLIRFGVPIGAAIAGSVNPNLLPQAAGLATGFTGEVTRQKKEETKLAVAGAKKKETARKEEKQDRKDIRKEAERSVDKSVEFIPDTATRQRKIDELEKAILEARGMTVQEISEKVREGLPETGALQSFSTEEEARKAGFDTGDRVNIGGKNGTLD